MFFERITNFSLFLKKEKNSSSSEITLFSQGSTSRKETFFFWGFLRHSPLWGLRPCSWHCRNFYLQSALYPQNMDAKWKPFCTRPMEKRGNERKLVPNISCHGRMRMFTLWGQHTAQQDWSQHPTHTPAGNLDSVPASLTEQCFPETVKGQISDFLSMLVKRLEYKCNSSLHYNDPSQASIHWQIMLYDITRVYMLLFVLLDWNTHEPFYSPNAVTKPMIENF